MRFKVVQRSSGDTLPTLDVAEGGDRRQPRDGTRQLLVPVPAEMDDWLRRQGITKSRGIVLLLEYARARLEEEGTRLLVLPEADL